MSPPKRAEADRQAWYAMAASPPAGWSQERKDDYVAWAKDVVAGCRHANAWLAAQFDAAAAMVS